MSASGGTVTTPLDLSNMDEGKRKGSHVELNPNQKGERGLPISPEDILRHELSHSNDIQEGKMAGQLSSLPSAKDPAEIRAVNFENRIRSSRGEKLRCTYNNVKITLIHRFSITH